MPLTYPLSLADFLEKLPVASMTFEAPLQEEVSQTAGGEVLSRRLAPPLWRGTVVLDRRNHADARLAAVLIQAAARGSFMIRDLTYTGPRSDPNGTTLGSATPLLMNINASGDGRIEGLPGFYWLRTGDYLAFTYGTNPTRHALHQVARDAQAGSGGTVTNLVLHPPVRPGWTASTAVTLVRPACKAVIVPGSFRAGESGRALTAGASFDFIQTLR